METSIFFKNLSDEKTPVPVSYLFLETLGVISEAKPDASLEVVVVMALIKLGHEKGTVEEKHLALVCERILAVRDEEIETNAEGKLQHRSGKKGFGEDYIKHISKLTMAQKCLVATGYNYEEARRLYCDVDKKIADFVVTTFVETKFEELKTNLEASVIGFGGSFGNDADVTFDLTSKEGMDEALSEMRSLGL